MSRIPTIDEMFVKHLGNSISEMRVNDNGITDMVVKMMKEGFETVRRETLKYVVEEIGINPKIKNGEIISCEVDKQSILDLESDPNLEIK